MSYISCSFFSFLFTVLFNDFHLLWAQSCCTYSEAQSNVFWAHYRWQFSEIWYIWPYGLTCFQNFHYHLQFWKHILKTDFLVWFPVELFNDGHSNEIWRSEEEYSIFISNRRQIHGHRQDLRITWGAAGILQHQHPQAWASETGHMNPTCGWTQPTLPVANVLWPLGKHQGITYSTTASHSPHITGYSLESHPVLKKKKKNLLGRRRFVFLLLKILVRTIN